MGLKTTLKVSLFCFVAAGLILAGCNGKGDQKSLTITSPENDRTISPTDDVSTGTTGIQINIDCAVDGFERGDQIVLRIEDEERNESSHTIQYEGSGQALFSSISFAAGTIDNPEDYYLRCTDRGRNVVSATVMIHVVGEAICPTLTWVDPTDGFSWSADDDANGNMDDGFQHDVSLIVDSPTGTSVTLYINGTVAGAASVQDNQAMFDDVDFPTVRDLALEIRIGLECTYTVTGILDVDVPECQIIDPSGTEWLNLDHDTDPGGGLQIMVVASSDDAATAELLVDGSSTGTASFSGSEASFENVAVDDTDLGGRCIQVICIDSAGNRGFSAESCYGVDSIAPTIDITDPADGAYFNDDSDVNGDIEGVQIGVSILSDQLSMSVELWSGDCSGAATPLVPEGTPTTDNLVGTANGQVSLGSMDGDHPVCARVTRMSGNTATDGITVTLDTEAPQVTIVRPTPVPDPIPDPPPVNADDGLILIVDDEVPSSDSGNYECEYTVLAECELVGRDVELYRAPSGSPDGVLIGTATCNACTDCTLPGKATFTEQNLAPTDVDPCTLYATHADAAGNTGRSSDVPVIVDTQPPNPIVTIPSCGGNLYLSSPYQSRVVVSIGDSGTSDLTINIYDSGGSPVTGSPYVRTPVAGLVRIDDVTFALGENSIEACTDDRYGQHGCNTTCTVTILDIPNITFEAPVDGTVLGSGDDLDSNPSDDLQYDIIFHADVPDGSATRLQVNGVDVAPSRTCTWDGSVCRVTYPSVTIPVGTNVPIMGCATDTRGEGCRTINVDVDLSPPSSIINLTMTVVHRREGRVRLDWTAPSDGGLAVDGYDVRCAPYAINDGNFETAPNYDYTAVPANPGDPDSIEVSGLFVGIGTIYWCAVKAIDNAENKSSLSNIPSQTIELLAVEIEGLSGTTDSFGFSGDALGDVNGDGFEDFAVGSVNNRVQLFFGDSSGVPNTSSVTITGSAGTFFGYSVCGIGNFDGDAGGLNDLAIGAIGVDSFKGEVYVFLGRTSWPATLSHTIADMTIIMDDPGNDAGAMLGFSVSSAGYFNDDTKHDLLVGSRGWSSNTGKAFVILGRSSLPPTLAVPGDGTTGFVGDFMFSAPVAGAQFGNSCKVIGNINADSLSDVACSAPATASGGSVYFFYGRSTSCPPTCDLRTINTSKTIDSPSTGFNFGSDIAGAGDVNGDGKPDLLVGAPLYPGDGSNQGAVYIYYHSGTEIDETSDAIITNGSMAPGGDRLGFALAAGVGLGFRTIGSIDNNMSDLLIGSANYDTDVGQSFLYLGSTSFPSSQTSENADLVFSYSGTAALINSRPKYVGDANNDGFADFAIGFPEHSSSRGEIVLYY